MPLFRRKGKGEQQNVQRMHESQPLACDESEEGSLPSVDEEIQKKAQDVMKDHLDIMRDVVMKIRHQEGYAKAMYANCPRLQHLLDRNPDLRPVFEDPRLVRINFETVYKEAGGILPEDEEEEERKRNNPSLIMRIANHPIFKILKVLLFLKKIIGCIAGGGIALVTGCWGCFTDCCTNCCCEDAIEQVGEYEDSDAESENEYGLDTDAPLDDNQRALNTAADYMEDPEVQEQMQRLLEDPENLEDAIENDAELRALRDSNPLCAELMQDPETMKILTDPDNLRALGEAPHMIELDFSDPHGFSPEADFVDVEANELDLEDSGQSFMEASGSMDGLEAYDMEYEENELYFPMEDDPNDLAMEEMQDSILPEDETGFEDELMDEEEEIEMTEVMEEEEVPPQTTTTTTTNWEDNFDMEQQEIDVDVDADADANADAAKGKGKAANKQRKTETQKQGGIAGVVSSLGVAATDVIAASIVGEVFGADFLPPEMMGGTGGTGLEAVDAAATQADALVNDDVADLAEDTADDIRDEKAANKEDMTEAERRRSRHSIGADGRKNYIGLLRTSSVVGGTTAVAAAAAAAAVGPLYGEDGSQAESLDDGLESIGSNESGFGDEDSRDSELDETPESKPKSKVGGFFKDLAAATKTAAKEHIVGTLLGGDLAEMLVEKQEEMAESSSDEEGEDDDDDEKKKKKKKGFSLFGRKNKNEEEDSAPALVFEPNPEENEYNPDFYQTAPDITFAANDDEEACNPSFYKDNREFSYKDDEDDTIEGSSSRRGYFG